MKFISEVIHLGAEAVVATTVSAIAVMIAFCLFRLAVDMFSISFFYGIAFVLSVTGMGVLVNSNA